MIYADARISFTRDEVLGKTRTVKEMKKKNIKESWLNLVDLGDFLVCI